MKCRGFADTGERAVEVAKRDRPDLILMDISLYGEMDGIMAAQRILECYPVPVVYMTGYIDDNTIKRAAQTVHYGLLMKPVDMYSLRLSVENALREHDSPASGRTPG
jgi:CheY-like chemotaxis protein